MAEKVQFKDVEVVTEKSDGSVRTEKITVGEAVSFWQKNKNWLWPVIVAVAALFGFSADKIYDNIPDIYNVSGLRSTVENHEVRITKLEDGSGQIIPPEEIPAEPAPEGDVKVERPAWQSNK